MTGELQDPQPPDQSTWTASDGYVLHYRHWRPASPLPAGYVVALHGIQSHSGWYEYSSRRLQQAGFDVRFLDRRGSGQNTEQRGHAPHPDRLINDVVQFLLQTRREREEKASAAPLFLLGVSWGGKLAAAVAARRSELLDGLVLLYPGLQARIRPNFFQIMMLRAAVCLGMDRRPIRIPLQDPALFTAEPQWQEYIRHDSLALHHVSTGFLYGSLLLDKELEKSSGAVSCPALLMLAGKDRIIDNRKTEQCFERLVRAERTVLRYPDAAHTLEFEPNREAIFSDLIDWLWGRASASSPHCLPAGKNERG